MENDRIRFAQPGLTEATSMKLFQRQGTCAGNVFPSPFIMAADINQKNWFAMLCINFSRRHGDSGHFILPGSKYSSESVQPQKSRHF